MLPGMLLTEQVPTNDYCSLTAIIFFLLVTCNLSLFFFFFQAEDGIRDYKVTGVQTCALPISICRSPHSACPRLSSSPPHHSSRPSSAPPHISRPKSGSNRSPAGFSPPPPSRDRKSVV